jgi:hypothetical protein
MSQSNWRFRIDGSVLDEGSGSPGWSASCWHRFRSAARGWLAAVPAPHRRERVQTARVIPLKAPKKLPRVPTPDEVQAILDGCGTG